VRAAALAAVAGILLAGCGSQKHEPLSKPAYERELRAAIGVLNSDLTKLGPAAEAAPKQVAGRIEQIQEAIRGAADRLDKVEPPADIRDAHEQLVDGLRELADEFDESREAAEKGNAEELREAQESLERTASARKLRRAIGRIQDAGYDVGF
jgi:outer membrane murein-binding lipoprotein Lpp